MVDNPTPQWGGRNKMIEVAGEGVAVIYEERHRQRTAEGYTAEYDSQHTNGELVTAALCYADPSIMTSDAIDIPWPMDPERHSRIRQLTIAGALIAAEIDRLRAAGE